MRVVVNDVVAVPGSGGVYSVLEDFYNRAIKLSEQNPDLEWIFILSGKYFKETKNVKLITRSDIKSNKIKRVWFDIFSGGHFINELNPDIFISLQNTMTMGIKRAKKWVYIHQPLPFQKEKRFSFLKKRERKLAAYQYLIGSVINFTVKHTKCNVIVQTEWMRNAILDKKIAKEENIFVVPPMVNDNLKSSSKKYVQKRNKFFFPSTPMLYKNHKILFAATRILERKGLDFSVKCTITTKDLQALNLLKPDSVQLVGMLPRSDVMIEYEKSILVFPSYIETFGLPLLEAQTKNDIILASNTSFSREILKNYSKAFLFNFNSEHELASLMEKTILNKLNYTKKIIEEQESHKININIVDLILQ